MQKPGFERLSNEEREEGAKWLCSLLSWFQTASVFTLAVVGVVFITVSIGFTNLNPRQDLINKANELRPNSSIQPSSAKIPLSKKH